MKVWLDKQGELHYHKADCPILLTELPPHLKYQELKIGNDIGERGLNIYPWGDTYSPCPICFGNRKNDH